MRKTRMLIPGLGLLILLAIAGCGDDEKCASCPEPAASPIGFTEGYLVLGEGAAYMNLEILGNGSGAPNLDTVKVGDSLVPRSEWDFTVGDNFMAIRYLINFEENGYPATYMYDHGDTATIKVYGEGRSSTCRLKVLDYMLSAANITSPADNADTLSPGAADTVYWNYIEGVDYYACMVAYILQWEGFPRLNFYFTTDTSFILTGAKYDSLAEVIQVFVTPFNGPDPRTGQSNWSGNLLEGVVYSFGASDYTTIHNLVLTKSTGEGPSQPEKLWPKASSEGIVADLYKQYRK